MTDHDKYTKNEKGLESFTRKDGKTYTMKDDKNRFLYPKEYMKLEDQLRKKQKHSVKFLINTGARIMEAQHVLVQDIDFINKRIVLRKTKTKAKKKERIGRMRTIPISTQFSKYLRKYIYDNKLEPTDKLNILSNPALNVAYKKAGEKAGIRDYYNISSHTMRKTLEVWLMALGVDSLPLTAHMGHDIATASQYYVSPDIFSWEEKEEMRQIIGDLYRR